MKNGERRSFDVTEIPFHAGGVLDKIYSVGSMVDITELDDLKQNLKLHQNAHLEILGALGTAFAVFDAKKKLSYYNKSFVSLWGLDEAWLEDQPSYAMFLDEIREKRMLPEVPDFIMYKNGEQNDFNSILEAKEDLLHLPDGRTIRRVRAQHWALPKLPSATADCCFTIRLISACGTARKSSCKMIRPFPNWSNRLKVISATMTTGMS